MGVQPGREAYKGAIERFAAPDAKPLVIRKMPFAESMGATVVALDTERGVLQAHFVCGPEFLKGPVFFRAGS